MWGLVGRSKAALLGVCIVVGLCLLNQRLAKPRHHYSVMITQYEPIVFLEQTTDQMEQDYYADTMINTSTPMSTGFAVFYLDTLLEEYNANVSLLRSEVLRSSTQESWPDFSVVRPKLLTSSYGFLERIKEHRSLHLQLLEIPRNLLHSVLRNQYYEYSSNDCTTIETNSKGSGKFLEMWFNATCYTDMRMTIAPQMMQSRAPLFLRISLPPKSNVDDTRAILTYMTLVEHAVLDDNGDVIIKDLEVIPIRCRETWVYDNLTRVDINAIEVFDEIFSAHQFFGKQFYHATMESLVRLAPYLAFLRQNPQIKIHLGYHHPFLPLLGISNTRIITQRVRGRLVYMPAGGGCGNQPVFPIQLLSDTLCQSTRSPNRDTLLLIQRSAAKTRSFKHHDEIVSALQDEAKLAGLRMAVFSDRPLPSLNETADLFSRAVIVISPHGAGAANLLFAQPGTVLIEALHPGPSHYPNLCFASMAQALGLRYHGLFKDSGVTEITAADLLTPVRFYLQHLSDL